MQIWANKIRRNMSKFEDTFTNIWLEWINEDELPEMSQEIYNAMFETSIVNGVRYFPCMRDINGIRFYLIDLKEQ
jgi:hypothetical protein